MPQNMADLRRLLSRLKPWVGVSVILAVALLGYFLFQGWRYLQASNDVSSLTREIDKIENNPIFKARTGDSASAKPNEQPPEGQRSVAKFRSLFRHQSVEDLMTIVAETASKAAVDLTSMNPDSPQTAIFGELQYQVQPLSISVEGSTADLYRFLFLLHENIPVVAASDIRIANLGTSPAAQVRLLFYLSPGPVEEPEQEGAD